MKSQHSNEQNYLFITPPEYEEATVKEGAVMVAESGNENDDSVEIKIGIKVRKIQSNFLYNID